MSEKPLSPVRARGPRKRQKHAGVQLSPDLDSYAPILPYCKVSRERVSGRARKWGCIISMGVPSPAGRDFSPGTGSHLQGLAHR